MLGEGSIFISIVKDLYFCKHAKKWISRKIKLKKILQSVSTNSYSLDKNYSVELPWKLPTI